MSADDSRTEPPRRANRSSHEQPEVEDRTVLSPYPALEDDERTHFLGQREQIPAGHKDDATIFAAQPSVEDDRTALAPQATEDDERTALAAPPPVASRPTDAQLRHGANPAPLGKLPPGTLINNNYEIIEELSAGGMGEVYRGVNIHGGPQVAIKAILHERAANSEAAELFKREAMTLSHLVDETIVRYYNYVHDRDLNRYFLVMEFIEGVPLKQHVSERGPLTVEQIKTLLRRVTRGLAKAHAQGVIHRDLSPDNIMLPAGIVGEARIIDFGIAMSAVTTNDAMQGRFAGKPKYVAPEQLGEFGGRIGPSADIYGLALLTCAVALGKPLDMGGTVEEAAHKRREPIDLSMLPLELQPLLRYMLEFDPADRPSGMEAVNRMVDHPEEIPAQYLGDWVPPTPIGTFTGTGAFPARSPVSGTVEGLQLPGRGGAAAKGKYGEPLVIEAEEAGDGLMGLMAFLLVVMLGAGGVYAWSQGLLPPQVAALLDFGRGKDQAVPVEQVRGIAAPDTATPEGFLAAAEMPECTLVLRVPTGPSTGTVEGYTGMEADFTALLQGYAASFGTPTQVLTRQVTPAQCAALDFTRALKGRGREGISLHLSTDAVPYQQPVTATLDVPRDQTVWVVVIDHRGRLLNVTSRMSQPVGDRRTVDIPLRYPGSTPQPHLVLAVESDSALTQTVLARNGADVVELLPKLLEEIAERDGAASVSLAFMTMLPRGHSGN